MKALWLLCFCGVGAAALGQAPAAAPVVPATAPAAAPATTAPAPAPAPAPAAAAPAPATAAPAAPTSGLPPGFSLGQNAPMFNPSNEIFTWDGHNWNVTDNRIYQARLEKYLNAPEEATADAQNYRQIINAILSDLAPGSGAASLDAAFRLLPKASDYDIDARLCDSIADAVYSVWSAQNSSQRLALANDSLEQERQRVQWNSQVSAESNGIDQGGASSKNAAIVAQWTAQQALKRTLTMQPYTTRLAEIMATIKANQAKKELSIIQAKIEFQALMVQLFLQRRFQHVLICTRFYRAIFTDGDTRLNVGKEAKNIFGNTTGTPPTVGTMDSMANEALRDVREGVESFEYLLSQHEMESASKRLAEAFAIGEYLPEIRTLPRTEKRQALQFEQKENQLVSALEVKDYTLAEKLVDELGKSATDCDTSKATAAIETAKEVSSLHLAKARNAAVSGDRPTLEEELRQATEIWPRNPALVQVSSLIFSQSDVQQKALVDLDQLISQKNYRQIYNDKMRFIAAAAMYPDRQQQLQKVLDQMQVIESGIMQAQEVEKRGDYPGAWEVLEKVFKKFPDDTKLSQLRADATTEAADFVRTLRTAEDLEQKDEVGSSLAWYLKAQKIYPSSEFAADGIQRLVKKILPEST